MDDTAKLFLARAALAYAKEMIDIALPQFNWGASALTGEGIRLLNETPGIVNRAIILIDQPSPVDPGPVMSELAHMMAAKPKGKT